MILFPDLMNAHRANDAAVPEAYGFPKDAITAAVHEMAHKHEREQNRPPGKRKGRGLKSESDSPERPEYVETEHKD